MKLQSSNFSKFLNSLRVFKLFRRIFLSLCRYRPVTEEPDLPWPYQFPFLPSYDMAVNEMHATPQSIDTVQDNPQDDLREGVVGV